MKNKNNKSKAVSKQIKTTKHFRNQKLVAISMHEKFIETIDAALPSMGYSNRSNFIRAAIVEKLHAAGIKAPLALSLAPSRRQRRRSQGVEG